MTLTYSVKTTSEGGEKQSSTLYVVRSDGSRMEPRVIQARDGKLYEQRTIQDAASGRRVVIEGVTQSLTTYQLNERETAALRVAHRDCQGNQSKEEERILGYRTTRSLIRLGETPLASSIERWVAPELDCAVLKERFTKRDHAGQIVATQEKWVTEIRLGEPAAELFAIPAWPERTPSQVKAELERKFGLKPETLGNAGDREQDAAYWVRQSSGGR